MTSGLTNHSRGDNFGQVFQDGGDLKDDGLDEAYDMATKRRLSDDSPKSAKKVKKVINSKTFHAPVKRHLSEDRANTKKIREFGEINAANLAIPGQKRNLNEDRDSGIKKTREFGEINTANLARPGEKRHIFEDSIARLKKMKDKEEDAEFHDSGIRMNGDSDQLEDLCRDVGDLLSFVNISEDAGEIVKMGERAVFVGGLDSEACGDRLLDACKNGNAEDAHRNLADAKYLASYTRQDDSGTNAYFYAKQNGMDEISQLIQKNVVSIFYEASINNDQELARDIWNQFASFEIDERKLFDILDPSEQYGVLAQIRVLKVKLLLRESQN